jgi:hypothetical protein
MLVLVRPARYPAAHSHPTDSRGHNLSTVTTVAKAVAAELNRHSGFSIPFKAAYSVKPSFDLAELDTTRVVVVPKAYELANITRASSRYVATLDVGIMQRIGRMTPEDAVDQLGGLVEEIIEFLKVQTLSDFPAGQVTGITNDPLYVPDHLTGQRTFTSVLTIQYAMRD